MKNNLLHTSILCLLLIIITGCSTPASVLQLAGQGVVITGKAESELDNFVARNNQVYEQRLEGVRRLSSSDIQAHAATEFENYTAERAGMQDKIELVTLIRELSDHHSQVRENALKQQAEMEKTLVVGEPISVPKEKYSELIKAFSVLSEELSPAEWLKFIVDYGQQVNDSLKKLKESAKDAEKKGNEENKKLQNSTGKK